MTNHIKFSALPPSLFLSNPTIALGNQTLETQSLGFDDNLYSPILITVQHCSTSELEVAQVKARWDISLIKTREQSRTGQGWSNCTSIIPLRALQLLPWARLDWPCKDTSPDMKMMMRSTLARAWGQIPECLRCDYTPRSGPTYTPMTNIQLQLQKKSFKDLFLKQNT